jgi:hypothetical protein
LTPSWGGLHDHRRAKLVRRLPPELHLTLFPQGNPRANGSFAQLKVIYIKINCESFSRTSVRKSRRRMMKGKNTRKLHP